MARLRNVTTGAVVTVDDEKATRLGSGWEPAEAPKPAGRARKPAGRKPVDKS